MSFHRARHRARTRPVGPVLAVALAVLAFGSTGTESGWTSAVVQNTADSASPTGALALTHTYNSTTCSSSMRQTAISCGATLGTAATPTASRTDTITNNSTIAVTQSVTGVSCAPVDFANAQSSTDPMLPRNSVVFQQSDKWGTTSAAGFSSTGYATDATGTNGSGLLGLLPSSYSFGLEFKSADSQGGGLLSLSSSLSNGSGAPNPTVWIDQSGNLHAFVSTTLTGTQLNTSGTNYANAAWHSVVVTVSTSLGVTTITLYVDGASKASSGGLTLLTSTAGIWHLGWSNFTGLTAPTSAYFHGSLSGAFVAQSAMSSTQVSNLQNASTASAYQSVLTGVSSIAQIWMLADNGYATYPGTSLPAGNINDPCSKVNVAFAFTNPTASIGAQSLKAFANNSATSVAAPAVGGTQSLTITTTQGATYNADLAGLHLYVPINFNYGTSPADANWVQTFSWAADPLDVFWA